MARCPTRSGACHKFRILAVQRRLLREKLALIADTSIFGGQSGAGLDALVRYYGKPSCIVSDNGTEFTSKAILKWANENAVECIYIDPGKPQQERLHRKLQRQPAGRMPERGNLRQPGPFVGKTVPRTVF